MDSAAMTVYRLYRLLEERVKGGYYFLLCAIFARVLIDLYCYNA